MIIGCDPGLTGAISLIDEGRLLECFDIPTCDNGQASGSMKRWVDAAAVHDVLREWSTRHGFAREYVTAVIERPIPMPTLPAQTIASQFDSFGVLRAMLDDAAHGPLVVVNPSEWKRFYGLKSDKEAARSTAMTLYPDAPVRRQKDHNRAESLLIAHWYWRTAA